MTVTQLQTTKRGRISVYVDGEFLFAAESDSVMRFGISEGCEVDEQLLNELLKDSRLIEAKRRALNMLSARRLITPQSPSFAKGSVQTFPFAISAAQLLQAE